MITKADLEKLHGEELADAERYDKLATENPDHAQILHDIAHEERTHADLIRHLISHM